MRHQYTRCTDKNLRLTIPSVDKDVEQLDLIYTASRLSKGITTLEKSFWKNWTYSYHMTQPFDFYLFTQEKRINRSIKRLEYNAHSRFTCNSQKCGETPKYPSTGDWMDRQTVVFPCSRLTTRQFKGMNYWSMKQHGWISNSSQWVK